MLATGKAASDEAFRSKALISKPKADEKKVGDEKIFRSGMTFSSVKKPVNTENTTPFRCQMKGLKKTGNTKMLE